MRSMLTKLVLGILGSCALAACGSGAGAPPDIGSTYGDSPGAFGRNDLPAQSQFDSPGTHGRGGGGGGAQQGGGTGTGTGNGEGAGTGTGNGGRDGGGTTTNPGTGTGTNPGTGTGTGTGTACIDCDKAYTCQVTQGTTTETQEVQLTTQGGKCTTQADANTVIFECDGSLVVNGNKIGTWAKSGNGFAAAVTQGDAATLTCMAK